MPPARAPLRLQSCTLSPARHRPKPLFAVRLSSTAAQLHVLHVGCSGGGQTASHPSGQLPAPKVLSNLKVKGTCQGVPIVYSTKQPPTAEGQLWCATGWDVPRGAAGATNGAVGSAGDARDVPS